MWAGEEVNEWRYSVHEWTGRKRARQIVKSSSRHGARVKKTPPSHHADTTLHHPKSMPLTARNHGNTGDYYANYTAGYHKRGQLALDKAEDVNERE